MKFLITKIKERVIRIIDQEEPYTRNLTIIIDQTYYSFTRYYLLREVDKRSYSVKQLEVLFDLFTDQIFKKEKDKTQKGNQQAKTFSQIIHSIQGELKYNFNPQKIVMLVHTSLFTKEDTIKDVYKKH